MDGTSSMRGRYRPPFHGGQSGGHSNATGGARFREQPDPVHSQQNRSWSWNRGGNANRGRGYRGRGRGGRGGYPNSFFQRQDRVDELDLYHVRDINNYFWGNEADVNIASGGSTLHGSKERPDDLAYMLLFRGANPRWAKDRIVFAKSKLNLLPEFTSKKSEHGEWETESFPKAKSVAATCPEESGVSNSKDDSISLNEGVTDTTSQVDKGDPPKVDDQDINKIDAGIDIYTVTENGRAPELSVDGEEPKVNAEETLVKEQIGAQNPTTTAHQFNQLGNSGEDRTGGNNENTTPFSTQEGIRETCVGGNDPMKDDAANMSLPVSTPTPDPPTRRSFRARYTDIRLEEGNNGFASGPTVPWRNSEKYSDIRKEEMTMAPMSTTATASSNRMKYTDIRKEEAHDSEDSTTRIMPEGQTHMKYTDVRLAPAQDFDKKPTVTEQQPALPTIAPIDYVPSEERPIAIFEERNMPGCQTSGNARFAFKGWFKLSRVNILAPQSAELVRMLQQKWERRDRFGNLVPGKSRDLTAWNSSMAAEWAVIKLEALEGKDAPPIPDIEKLPEPEPQAELEAQPERESDAQRSCSDCKPRGVNELLADMRLNDGKIEQAKVEEPKVERPEVEEDLGGELATVHKENMPDS